MNKLLSQANVDAIFNGQYGGRLANVLLASGMDIRALRPWVERHGANATLRKDEWVEVDDAVTAVGRIRMTGVNDLLDRNLRHDLKNGLGTTMFEVENVSDMNEAELNMFGETGGSNDAIEYGLDQLPMPLVSKGFFIPLRKLESSRGKGESLDTAQASIAAIKVAEKTEEILFRGASSFSAGGAVLRGYQDHPKRSTVTLTQAWDASAGNGAVILSDIMGMIQAAVNAKHYGPFVLYIPTAYQRTLGEDYSASYGKSLRKRILEIEEIEDVKVADSLTADNVMLVEMTPASVRMIVGVQPTTIEWETMGGLIKNFKIISIMVPQILVDSNDKTGIVHGTVT